MYDEAEYFVLQCGRCRLIHPYERRRCVRCGALEAEVARVGRAEVMEAALQFLVPPQAVAMPRELALTLRAPARTAAAPARTWVVALRQRAASLVAALRPATATAPVRSRPTQP